MLITFAFFSQAFSTPLVNILITLSKLETSKRLDILMFLIDVMMSLIKDVFSSLSLIIEHLVELIFFSSIGIVIVKGA